MSNKHGLYFPIVLNPEGSPVKPEILDSITASVRHILVYSKGDRNFNINFGCGLNYFLGMPMTPENLTLLKVNLEFNINAQDPRIKIQEIDLTPTSKGLLVITLKVYVKELRLETEIQSVV